MKYYNIYQTAMGVICITEEEGKITGLGFGTPSQETSDSSGQYYRKQETPLLKQAAGQLEEYLKGGIRDFDLPLDANGTPYQKKVWQALLEIPYGETRTYGQIAVSAGSPKGARAVGMACNRNPIMVFIPCHRVIGSNGSLTGFGGGLAVKEMLLGLEAGLSCVKSSIE